MMVLMIPLIQLFLTFTFCMCVVSNAVFLLPFATTILIIQLHKIISYFIICFSLSFHYLLLYRFIYYPLKSIPSDLYSAASILHLIMSISLKISCLYNRDFCLYIWCFLGYLSPYATPLKSIIQNMTQVSYYSSSWSYYNNVGHYYKAIPLYKAITIIVMLAKFTFLLLAKL